MGRNVAAVVEFTQRTHSFNGLNVTAAWAVAEQRIVKLKARIKINEPIESAQKKKREQRKLFL